MTAAPTAPPFSPPPAAAMFDALGDGRFRATEHTGGPWDPELQHGGPPSALLTRAMEDLPGLDGALTRVSVDLLGPVPVGEVSVRAEVARPGRSVELLVAEMAAGGRTAVRATAWRVRRAELDYPTDAGEPLPGPPPMPEVDSPPPEWPGGFLRAMQ